MIDDPEKTDRLVTELKASLPVETRPSKILRRAIVKQTPDLAVPDSCSVVSIFYTGEEGGIVCGLDIGGPDTKTPYIVSITHLSFDRRMSLFRQIDVINARSKKLKQQSGRNYSHSHPLCRSSTPAVQSCGVVIMRQALRAVHLAEADFAGGSPGLNRSGRPIGAPIRT